jgi:hypothetical protein
MAAMVQQVFMDSVAVAAVSQVHQRGKVQRQTAEALATVPLV